MIKFKPTKTNIIGIIIALGLLLLGIFFNGLYEPNGLEQTSNQKQVQSNNVTVVSTTPSKLDESTILPNQTLEINFSDGIEQSQKKVQLTIEPTVDYKVEVTNGNKTLKIIPNKPFGFDQAYTLKVTTDTNFEGGKKLDNDVVYRFKTIPYKGV